MAALIFLLLMGSFIKGTRAASLQEKAALLNALTFINTLRTSTIVCENHGVHLPIFSMYPTAPSLNKAVRNYVDREYTKFWKDLRRRDYYPDMNRLVNLSKGAALELVNYRQNRPDMNKCRGHSEARLLQPIFFADTSLKASYYSCLTMKDENVLDCLEKAVMANEEYKGLKGEMILGSIGLLQVALQVSITGWYCISKKLDDLRSDTLALKTIRTWDYNIVIPQILYLKFILHARFVISSISGDSKEALAVLTMQKDLEQAIQTEFRLTMMKEL